MDAGILPSLRPKPCPFTTNPQLSSHARARATATTTLLRLRCRPAATPSTTTNTEGDDENTAAEPGLTDNSPPRPQPAAALGIRYQSRSQKKRARQLQEQGGGYVAPPKPPPKDWEDMTLTEKAVELYVGEKGLLFWLNKFAYASIFIIIGAWILFRFVGPSLGLYQLDAPPLPPAAVFRGGGSGSG